MIYSFELDYSNYSYISITLYVKQLFLLRNILIFPCIYFPEKCYTQVRLEAYKKRHSASFYESFYDLMTVSFFNIFCMQCFTWQQAYLLSAYCDYFSSTRFFMLPRLITRVEVL